MNFIFELILRYLILVSFTSLYFVFLSANYSLFSSDIILLSSALLLFINLFIFFSPLLSFKPKQYIEGKKVILSSATLFIPAAPAHIFLTEDTLYAVIFPSFPFFEFQTKILVKDIQKIVLYKPYLFYDLWSLYIHTSSSVIPLSFAFSSLFKIPNSSENIWIEELKKLNQNIIIIKTPFSNRK